MNREAKLIGCLSGEEMGIDKVTLRGERRNEGRMRREGVEERRMQGVEENEFRIPVRKKGGREKRITGGEERRKVVEER